jgi:CxxC motif-containing protein
MCGRGEDYVKRELISPMRMLTSSVRVVGGEREIVSVRTTSGIPKQAINEAMKRIKSLIVVAPISAGEIIEKDFMTFGVDLIATSKVL